MQNMILVYTTCESLFRAKALSKLLLKKRLCACTNILPNMTSLYLWPAKSKKITKSKEVILLIKTLKAKYKAIEKTIKANHTYETPAIFSISIDQVSKDYYAWIEDGLVPGFGRIP